MPETPEIPAAFQPPANIEGPNPVANFDIEAWRAGRKTPTRVVPVTNDPGAGLRLTELEERELKIRTGHAVAQAEGRRIPGKRAGSTTTPELEQLKTDIRAVLDALDGTWSYIHVRALTPREANKVADIENRVERIAAALAIAATMSGHREVVGEVLAAEAWHDVLDTIGLSQTLKVERALNELTEAVVTPDFSRRVSALLDTPDSSSS